SARSNAPGGGRGKLGCWSDLGSQSFRQNSVSRPTRKINGHRAQGRLRHRYVLDRDHSAATCNVRWSAMSSRFIAVILVSLEILTYSSRLFAQTQDDLFNGDILHEVR